MKQLNTSPLNTHSLVPLMQSVLVVHVILPKFNSRWSGRQAMQYAVAAAVLGAVVMLGGCGETPRERTTGGAAAGAATGAGIGALAGPPGVVVGGLVGGGAGAITGAATSPSQVNLGKPPWTNPETRVPAPSRTAAQRSSSYRSSVDPQRVTVEQLNEQSLERAQQRNYNSP
jgi:hypothetical protein